MAAQRKRVTAALGSGNDRFSHEAQDGRNASRIFISYRREDSDIWAGRLADELRKHFSAEQVFQDIASIGPTMKSDQHSPLLRTE